MISRLKELDFLVSGTSLSNLVLPIQIRNGQRQERTYRLQTYINNNGGKEKCENNNDNINIINIIFGYL